MPLLVLKAVLKVCSFHPFRYVNFFFAKEMFVCFLKRGIRIKGKTQKRTLTSSANGQKLLPAAK